MATMVDKIIVVKKLLNRICICTDYAKFMLVPDFVKDK